MNDQATQATIEETAIIVTDPQLAIKANRNANTGFMFYAMGSPIKNKKFTLIIFACNLYTHVMKEWAKSIIKDCLEENGKIMGYIKVPTIIEEVKLPPKIKPKVDKAEAKAPVDIQAKKLARRKAKKSGNNGKA